MGIWDIIVLAVVGIIAGFAFRSILKGKGSSCGGACPDCSGCAYRGESCGRREHVSADENKEGKL